MREKRKESFTLSLDEGDGWRRPFTPRRFSGRLVEQRAYGGWRSGQVRLREEKAQSACSIGLGAGGHALGDCQGRNAPG